MSYLRLRQICLVASDLDKVTEQLVGVLGAKVCFRDEGVEKYGLHNVLFALGGTFLEVVSPLREGTAAGRYIERRKGDGGYMYIVDCDDLEARREHFKAVNARAVEDIERSGDGGRSAAIHLHPKDTGGCLLSVDRHSGGEDVMGEYLWAGPRWKDEMRGDVKISGATMQCDDPQKTAARWAELLRRPVMEIEGGWEIAMDNAYARFVPLGDDRGEGLCGIELACGNPGSVAACANALGVIGEDGVIDVCGVGLTLRAG